MHGTGRSEALPNVLTRLSRTVRAIALSCALGSIALASSGCNTTPTLPLPPPIAMADTPDEQGFALVRGEAKSRSYVSILNERTDQGVITRAGDDGKFEARIAAKSGDPLTVWQQIDGETSEPYFIDVR